MKKYRSISVLYVGMNVCLLGLSPSCRLIQPNAEAESDGSDVSVSNTARENDPVELAITDGVFTFSDSVVNPLALEVGDAFTGNSITKEVTIKNQGSAETVDFSFSTFVVNDQSAFTISTSASNDCADAGELSPQETCNVIIVFTPPDNSVVPESFSAEWLVTAENASPVVNMYIDDGSNKILQIVATESIPPKTWLTASIIDEMSASTFDPSLAVDSDGNALVIWSQMDGVAWQESIYAKRYVPGSGWQAAELIESQDGGNARESQIQMDTSGNAMAIWRQDDGVADRIYAARYVVGSGWQPAGAIQTGLSGALRPQIAVNAQGDAFAVWEEYDGARYNIRSNRYVIGSGWQTDELIEASASSFTSFADIAVDNEGNAIAVWSVYNGSINNLWANRYVSGSGWQGETLIETTDLGSALGATVAFNNDGDATVVWYQYDGTRGDIWTNRYLKTGGWQTATLLETEDDGNAVTPTIAFDGSGNALAVWSQNDGTRSNIHARRFDASEGWQTPEIIESGNDGDAQYPEIAFDGNGNAMATWRQSNGTLFHTWANRYVKDLGWQSAGAIDTVDTDDSSYSYIGMDSEGRAMVVWVKGNGGGSGDVYANRFE